MTELVHVFKFLSIVQNIKQTSSEYITVMVDTLLYIFADVLVLSLAVIHNWLVDTFLSSPDIRQRCTMLIVVDDWFLDIVLNGWDI